MAMLVAAAVAWDLSSSPARPARTPTAGSPLAGSLRSAAREVASGIAAEYAPALPPAATVATTAPAAAPAPVAAVPTGGVVITATKAIVIGPGVIFGGSGVTLRCK